MGSRRAGDRARAAARRDGRAGGSVAATRSRAAGSPSPAPLARAAARQQCADRYSAKRDPANPLALATAPGSDPLTGASFFVDGPAHGDAAGSIAKLLGLNPASLSATESWSTFASSLTTGGLLGKLTGNSGLANQVQQLSKIAAQPEVQRISAYSGGGGRRSDLRPDAEAAVQQRTRRSRGRS